MSDLNGIHDHLNEAALAITKFAITNTDKKTNAELTAMQQKLYGMIGKLSVLERRAKPQVSSVKYAVTANLVKRTDNGCVSLQVPAFTIENASSIGNAEVLAREIIDSTNSVEYDDLNICVVPL